MGLLESESAEEKKEKGKKEKRENRGVFQRIGLCILHHSSPFFLEQSLVESKDRLSIKDLGLDLKIWQEHINF